jgi:hypothetical protein
LETRYEKGMIGVEYESAKWSEFRFYNQPDKLTDSWQFRLGGQFIPNPLGITSYWNRVTFRAGFYTGVDYVNADGNELKVNGAYLWCRSCRFASGDHSITNLQLLIQLLKLEKEVASKITLQKTILNYH